MSAAASTTAPAAIRTVGRHDRAVLLTGFAVGTALYVWRVWDRLRPPGIYAEDGLIFYLQAAELGWPAVVRPYAGYLHLVPRLGAWAVSPFGLTAVPVAYTVFTVAVTVGVFALVLSRRLDRVIPSAWSRALAFVLLCGVPQVWETATVMASLIFTGGFGLVVLGLSRAPGSTLGRVGEAVLVVLLGLSGPLVVFFSPLFLWRWWRERTRPNLVLLGLVAATAITQLIVYLTSSRAVGNFGFRDVGRVYLQRVAGELVGSRAGVESAFDQHDPVRWLILGWFVAVLVVVLAEVRWDAVFALGVSGVALAWAVRTYGGIALTDPINGDRHILVPASVLVLCLVAAVAQAVHRAGTPGKGRRWHVAAASVAGVAVLATGLGMAAGWRIPAYDRVPSEAELNTFQECLDDGRQDCGWVWIAPDGYVLHVVESWDD